VHVYGGTERQKRTRVDVLPWSMIDGYDWTGRAVTLRPSSITGRLKRTPTDNSAENQLWKCSMVGVSSARVSATRCRGCAGARVVVRHVEREDRSE